MPQNVVHQEEKNVLGVVKYSEKVMGRYGKGFVWIMTVGEKVKSRESIYLFN